MAEFRCRRAPADGETESVFKALRRSGFAQRAHGQGLRGFDKHRIVEKVEGLKGRVGAAADDQATLASGASKFISRGYGDDR